MIGQTNSFTNRTDLLAKLDLFRVQDAADVAGVTPLAIHRGICLGLLRRNQRGGQFLVAGADLANVIAGRTDLAIPELNVDGDWFREHEGPLADQVNAIRSHALFRVKHLPPDPSTPVPASGPIGSLFRSPEVFGQVRGLCLQKLTSRPTDVRSAIGQAMFEQPAIPAKFNPPAKFAKAFALAF